MNDMLNAVMAKYMTLQKLKVDELAIKLHVSRATLYNGLNNPYSYNLKELRKLFNVLGFTQDEILEVMYKLK